MLSKVLCGPLRGQMASVENHWVDCESAAPYRGGEVLMIRTEVEVMNVSAVGAAPHQSQQLGGERRCPEIWPDALAA